MVLMNYQVFLMACIARWSNTEIFRLNIYLSESLTYEPLSLCSRICIPIRGKISKKSLNTIVFLMKI